MAISDNPHAAIPRYPLEWPLGWRQTPPQRRQRASFATKATVDGRLTIAKAVDRLEREVERLGGRFPVLSTNVTLTLTGQPRSNEEPKDPGAALYFMFKGKATVLACDKWTRVADNIAALAAHIDALRRVDRYGVGTIEQALAGYKALPADTAADWRSVFGLKDVGGSNAALIDRVDQEYKLKARHLHPDVTGDDGAAMAHLNRARDYALAELNGNG